MQNRLTKQEEKAYAELAKAAKRIRQLQERRERQRANQQTTRIRGKNREVTSC